MNATTSIEQFTKRRGAVLAEYHAFDDKLPITEELMKLASFVKEFPDFNLNYLLFDWGEPRKRDMSSFYLNPALVKKGTALQWDDYIPNFVTKVRKALGLSQYELAEEMQKTGIYRGFGLSNFIHRMEKGSTRFRFIDFISLVVAVRSLGYPITFGEIFGEKAREETLDSNLLEQKIEILREEIKSKDEIITRYKNLLDQR